MRKEIYFRFFIIFLTIFPVFLGCSRDEVSPPTFKISGTVSVNTVGTSPAGIRIDLTGAGTANTTTGSDGTFSFTGLGAGTYTLTPSLANHTFDPASRVVVISDDDVADIEFMAIDSGPVGPYSISGNVSGDVAQGVKVDLKGTARRTATTDSSGNYNFTSLANGNYTVNPSYKNTAFNPANAAVTVSGTSVTGKNFTSTLLPTSTYTQSDLTGKWRVHELTADTSSQWMRAVVNVNSSGVVTCETYEDSTGETTCPNPLDLAWTIDAEGKVTESGTQADKDVHMNLAANKNFIAGAGNLRIIQKTATTFTSSDLNNTSFVYHQLKVGSINEWRHGAGTIGSDGTMTITSEITPTGPATPSGNVGTISVDTSGVVLLSGTASFKGFLSDDKKTLVATKTETSSYVLMVIQITGKAYAPGSLPDSVANAVMQAGGVSPAPLWAYWTAITSGGTMAMSDYWVSNVAYPASDPVSPLIDAGGAVTISGYPYHGQMSDDEEFIIGTQTLNSTGLPFGYAMVVHTRK